MLGQQDEADSTSGTSVCGDSTDPNKNGEQSSRPPSLSPSLPEPSQGPNPYLAHRSTPTACHWPPSLTLWLSVTTSCFRTKLDFFLIHCERAPLPGKAGALSTEAGFCPLPSQFLLCSTEGASQSKQGVPFSPCGPSLYLDSVILSFVNKPKPQVTK